MTLELLSYHVRRAFWTYARHGAQYRRDATALQALTPLASPYVPWTDFAMRPSGLVAVINDIVVNQRTHIVECGGGISTLFIGRLLREREGHLYTVEEDAGWAERLSQELEAEQLTERVSVIHAPISEVRIGGGTYPWYSDAAVSRLIGRREIDLLLVDGPVAEHRPQIRYPALPYFYDSLQAGATVILDDIDRRGEQQIVKRWEGELGLSFERRFLNGIAVAAVT
jgi:hypothetical protein